jgi:hypothetical protein
MGKANLILVAIDAYVVAVNLVKKYFFIPSMIEGVYKDYKEHRVAGIAEFNLNEAEKVFNIIGHKGKINNVVTEMKKQIAKEKYGFNEKGMTTRFKLKVQDEARKLLIAQMEQRYQKERIPEMMKVASDKAKEKRGSYVNKVKDKLEMPIRGVVVDAETSKKIEGAKVGVKRKSYAVYTRANGSFYLDVPYRLVEGRSFHIYAVGKEYEGEYSQQITWKETKIPPRIRFELNAVVDELDNLRNEYCEKVGIVGLMTKEACLTQVMAAEKVGCKRDGLSEEECTALLVSASPIMTIKQLNEANEIEGKKQAEESSACGRQCLIDGGWDPDSGWEPNANASVACNLKCSPEPCTASCSQQFSTFNEIDACVSKCVVPKIEACTAECNSYENTWDKWYLSRCICVCDSGYVPGSNGCVLEGE